MKKAVAMGKKHCCDMMEKQINYKCPEHINAFDCPDILISYTATFDEYGIIIHDGGISVIGINFCPWCGSHLPESKRDRWFEELETLGFTDPFEQDILEKFKTDEWYRTTV
jgi:hypothetical protein